MRTELVSTSSVDEPVTVAEAKQHLNDPENIPNSQILFFIQTAKEQVEHKLGRKLIAQTWDLFMDSFPTNEIELPYGPLASVSYVQYYDADNVLQTVTSTDYVVDTSGTLGRVYLAYSKFWPTPLGGLANAVNIRFVAGYPNPDAIPQSIKHYMKLLVSEFAMNRELTTEREVYMTPWAERLLDPYRVDFVI